jgi:hypothetical protein
MWNLDGQSLLLNSEFKSDAHISLISALLERAYDEMVAKRQEKRQSSKKMEGLEEEEQSLMDDIFSYSQLHVG